MWRGRLFGAQWRPAIGGSLDVLEPATGAVITRVGNATAEDVRQAAAEARAAQPGWAATPYDQRAAHPAQGRRADGGEPGRARLLDHARDRRHRAQGGLRGADGDQHPAPLGRDVHGAPGTGAAERRRPPIARPARAARRHRRDLAVQLPAHSVEPRGRARARHRQRGRAQARSAHRAHRRLHHRAAVRGSRACPRACCRCCPAAPRPARRSAPIPTSRWSRSPARARSAAASASSPASISRRCSSSSAARTP